MHNRASFLAFRLLIAFFQGGFIPDAILYLGYFYTVGYHGHLAQGLAITHLDYSSTRQKHQLPIRLAIFWLVRRVCLDVSAIAETSASTGVPTRSLAFLMASLPWACSRCVEFSVMPAGNGW
jgi:hypothetical protein